VEEQGVLSHVVFLTQQLMQSLGIGNKYAHFPAGGAKFRKVSILLRVTKPPLAELASVAKGT
jgi:hypothetical protein